MYQAVFKVCYFELSLIFPSKSIFLFSTQNSFLSLLFQKISRAKWKNSVMSYIALASLIMHTHSALTFSSSRLALVCLIYPDTTLIIPKLCIFCVFIILYVFFYFVLCKRSHIKIYMSFWFRIFDLKKCRHLIYGCKILGKLFSAVC